MYIYFYFSFNDPHISVIVRFYVHRVWGDTIVDGGVDAFCGI